MSRPKLTRSEKRAKAKTARKTPSQATGRKPSKRLVARRTRNLIPGTFPNPRERGRWLLVARSRKDGRRLYAVDDAGTFDTSRSKAKTYRSLAAVKGVAVKLSPRVKTDYTLLGVIA